MAKSGSSLASIGVLLFVLGQASTPSGQHQCGFAEVAREIKLNPGGGPTLSIPSVATRSVSATSGSCVVTPNDIFAYEDSASLLLTDFTFCELEALMVDASNALMVAHGDNFDFVAFFLNFVPDHQIGGGFYSPIENDTLGVGDIGLPVGLPDIYNRRPSLGLAGDEIEGFVMMWVVDSWVGGAGPPADFTRLVLGQEFHHRFALFLPPLLDGRVMQGDDFICGRSFHWNWQIDGQGSSMELSEWVGSSPAVPASTFVSFNTDIPGTVFSYTDLYLMGYVTPAEMDAGNSELRFMEGSDCSSNHFGTISTFGSADIIATAGPRIPNSAAEDKDYRTGWVMFHLPGQPPTMPDLTLAASILNQHSADWSAGTLGRGSMCNTLPVIAAVPAFGIGSLSLFTLVTIAGGVCLLRRKKRGETIR